MPTRGFGHEPARQLAAPGHTVLRCARRAEDAGRAVGDLAAGVSGTLPPYRLDVTAADGVRAVARGVEAEFGRLDVLVGDAAISYDTARRTLGR